MQMRYWRWQFPQNTEYNGRFEGLEGVTKAFSRDQAISGVLAEHGCRFLYEEYRTRSDVRVHEIEKPQHAFRQAEKYPVQGSLF